MLELAGVIIQNESQEILLLHRNTPKRTQWEILGGKVEKGETYEETAIRETKEELGVDIEIIKKIGNKDFSEDDYTMSYTWFSVKIINGEPCIMEKDKFDGLSFWSLNDLKNTTEVLSPNTKNFLNYMKNL